EGSSGARVQIASTRRLCARARDRAQRGASRSQPPSDSVHRESKPPGSALRAASRRRDTSHAFEQAASRRERSQTWNAEARVMKLALDPRIDPTTAVVRAQISNAQNSHSAAADFGRALSQYDLTNALARLAQHLGWSDRTPFANVVPKDARVLIKPNFVLHENRGEWGMEPLVTAPGLIKAVTDAALASGAAEVLVGDAPLQSCDFDVLLAATGLDRWSKELMKRESRFKGVGDFRRTTCRIVDGIRIAEEDLKPEDSFVLFDLGRESLLEPFSDDRRSFRVTRYDPRLMARTHSSGRHQYLVAREVLDADLIINLPKLKTHKKAGVTCALKNLIGINGNKEYLPHHRVGGSQHGGDCYPGNS